MNGRWYIDILGLAFTIDGDTSSPSSHGIPSTWRTYIRTMIPHFTSTRSRANTLLTLRGVKTRQKPTHLMSCLGEKNPSLEKGKSLYRVAGDDPCGFPCRRSSCKASALSRAPSREYGSSSPNSSNPTTLTQSARSHL